jgi:GT2 family glycosyltransferase
MSGGARSGEGYSNKGSGLLDKKPVEDSALEKALSDAEEQRRAFLELCLKYDRTLGDMMMSRSWRVGRLLSAIWARLPAFLQRQILRVGRRAWPLLVRFRRNFQDDLNVEQLRMQLYSWLVPGIALSDTDIWTGDNPKVSVVSSLYGNRSTLAPFLNALRNQDYDGAIQVILVDDASPDGAGDAAIALATQLTGNKFLAEVIRNTENIGNCGSRNRGIAAASGDYLVVIDPDCIVNRRFIRTHVHNHLRGFDVVLGPMGIESGTENAETLVNRLELLGPAGIALRMRLQDISAPASSVNCVTRNFSISREMLARLGRPLFDERYAYRKSRDTGFGWEDVQMGAALRRIGARIAFSWNAFSVHMSHPAAVDDGTKARGSAKNFIRLIEEHPELVGEAPDWAEITAARITRWQQGFGSADPKLSEITKSARAAKSKSTRTDVTVYTGVTGRYDRVRPARRGVAARHLLFSDRADEAPGWETRAFDLLRPDPIRTAKAPKILAHRYLADCEWSVWIDANIELIASAQSLIAEVERSGCSIGVFRHPERHCAFDEGTTCIKRGKDAVDRISAQLHRYKDRGFPRQFGLAECNVIVRRHSDPKVKEAMETWWDEIEKGSRRDQISFTYALWRSGLAYHELGNGLVDVRSDKRFVYHLHGAEMELRSSAEA